MRIEKPFRERMIRVQRLVLLTDLHFFFVLGEGAEPDEDKGDDEEGGPALHFVSSGSRGSVRIR